MGWGCDDSACLVREKRETETSSCHTRLEGLEFSVCLRFWVLQVSRIFTDAN